MKTSWRVSCSATAYASLARLLDHDGPAQRLERSRDAEHLDAAVVGEIRATPDLHRAGRGRDATSGWFAQIVAARDARLFIRVAVCDQLPVRRDDKRKSLVAHSNPIDHPPHFFEADFADQRSRGLADLSQLDPDDRSRQEVVINADWRQRDIRSEICAGMRKLNLRLANATRCDLHARSVVQRNLAKLGEVQNGILQNAVLLPLSQIGVREISCD